MSAVQFTLALALLAWAAPAFGSPLAIANRTECGILNILAQTPKRIFLRVDLTPGAREEVENPACVASLRADTGLALWTFPAIDLTACQSLTFCPEHGVCLIAEEGKESRHIQGKVTELVPSGHPVCNLDNFHPAMSMGEVCDILPGKMQYDDNGALLTGMGFAGLAWAARLVPAQNGPVSSKSLLEHLELRRVINRDDLVKLLDTLIERGYIPWQAEFPGIDLEFDAKADMAAKKEILINSLAGFLAAYSQKGHSNHALREKCEEASIIFAPAKLLPILEKADDPPQDVDIYTVIIRPCTNTMLLDVAAYR